MESGDSREANMPLQHHAVTLIWLYFILFSPALPLMHPASVNTQDKHPQNKLTGQVGTLLKQKNMHFLT